MKLAGYESLVKEIEDTAQKFYAFRYQMSNGGNLSVRIPDKNWMIVKGTDVAFDEVGPDTLVIMDFDGNVIEGGLKPSKEALLHGAIYKEKREVNAIMHCHSPFATAWAANHEGLTFATHHSDMKLFGKVPVFDTHSYVVPREYFGKILEFFSENPKANSFLLRGHGQVTLGADMREAAHLAELVEETAQIAIFSQRV